jgi:hypothetical protein
MKIERCTISFYTTITTTKKRPTNFSRFSLVLVDEERMDDEKKTVKSLLLLKINNLKNN